MELFYQFYFLLLLHYTDVRFRGRDNTCVSCSHTSPIYLTELTCHPSWTLFRGDTTEEHEVHGMVQKRGHNGVIISEFTHTRLSLVTKS